MRIVALVLAALVLAPAPAAAWDEIIGPLDRPLFGDLDAMVERGVLRMLVVPSQTNFFMDGARQRGLTYEIGQQFQKALRKDLGLPRAGFDIAYIPVARDELVQRLLEGRGDVAAANLTITPGREQEVAFGSPFATNQREWIVTAPDAPPVDSLDDLSGRTVAIRASSSYAESLAALNRRFLGQGRAPVEIQTVPEVLETEDILEMVAQGLYDATVADQYLVELWMQVFPQLRVNREVALRKDVKIAWAFRKDSPKLKAAVDAFTAKHRQGTLLGNILLKRYLADNEWVKNARGDAARKRFEGMVALFDRFGSRYDFDSLLLAAQGYQESGLDQSVVSPAGAVGVMQLLRSTASSPEVAIPDIDVLDRNIEAGAKYMRVIADRYFDDPALTPVDRHLFALAAYNAGPTRIRRIRGEAAAAGFDPNRWFGHVEHLVAHEVGREPVQYVRNIYKYYLAYTLLREEERRRDEAREAASG